MSFGKKEKFFLVFLRVSEKVTKNWRGSLSIVNLTFYNIWIILGSKELTKHFGSSLFKNVGLYEY